MANNSRHPLIFIGFMGTGKSTLAKHISNNEQLSFVDLDSYIVKKENKSIPQIFSDSGESGFRKLETKYLEECINKYDVIATGGGIIESATALKLLASQQYVFWLDCDLNIIYDRIKNDSNRPNANNKSYTELNDLYLKRVSRYNEIAFTKLDSANPISILYEVVMNHINSD